MCGDLYTLFRIGLVIAIVLGVFLALKALRP